MSPVISRELMERGQAVAVLLYDQQRDAVIMIEQFRIGAIHDSNGAWLLELVAGMIEEGEQPEQVARRESMEESGCEIKKLELRVRVLPWGEVETMLTAGEINNATALIGLQWLQIQKLANKL